MDPLSVAGLAIGVASIGLQVYTHCVQGIQLLVTAANFPEDCRYLNLRLRMEQQRLFAWSETSGLLALDANDRQKILESNTFILHRQTVLDLLVQVECLFKEFREQQIRYRRLQTIPDDDHILQQPEKDAAEASFPLPTRRRDFIKKAMQSLKASSKEGALRLRWASFDKAAFELLLAKFSALNDSMTNILDARLQVEIHHTVQDTNRGVLQLHHKIADLSRLVMALNLKLETSSALPVSPMAMAQKRANADSLQFLSQLAKFKAFNESIESDNKAAPLDEATAMCLELGKPGEKKHLLLDRSMIELGSAGEDVDLPRCDAILRLPDGQARKVWVEWKEYDRQRPGDMSPPKEVIVERVWKLAALLNHKPKPDAFRTPHCLGFFDKAGDGNADDDEDILNMRLGLVFERPLDNDLDQNLPPISLRELLQLPGKPRVTERVKLAHAISNCLLYLHAVNWLHKGLRSHNIIFFRKTNGTIDYSKPYLSGFDFSRPARPDEMTDFPGDNAEHNLYRHPHAQSPNPEQRQRFKRSFDIYSLGVLMVEIAHWAPIERVLGLDLDAVRWKPSIALRVREQLLAEDQISALGACMGEIYEVAARKCIAGGAELGLSEEDDETDSAVAARLSMVLHENVVKPLGDIRI